jgi:hypothetical protein
MEEARQYSAMTNDHYFAGFLFLFSALFAWNFASGIRTGKVIPLDGGLKAKPVRRSEDLLSFRIYVLGSLILSIAAIALGLIVLL